MTLEEALEKAGVPERFWNRPPPPEEKEIWRCTVCGFVVDLSYEAEFPNKKAPPEAGP